jgi:glucose-1-phosphate adenylyltransferase
MQSVLAILLAGGAGERLFPLTRNTAKPAVPFGGTYRIIDFTLSNCINSGIRRIFILTQYKALELTRHLREGWNLFAGELGEFIEVIPPMKRVHEDWYLGTADAVYQNLESVAVENPRETLILPGDNIYKMDYGAMVEWHRDLNADLTIATLPVAPAEASRFGVADIDENHRIRGFEEKPQHDNPARSAFDAAMVSVSMGVYVFATRVMVEVVRADAEDPLSSHDFGRDIIPKMLHSHRVAAYDFPDLNDKARPYWRDVGTLDAYYEANMDLVSVTPEFNLYDLNWPIRTRLVQAPPAKFVFAQEGRRMGVAMDSVVGLGVIVSGGRVTRSVLSPGVRVNSFSEVESSIVLHNATVGRYCRVQRAIIDQGVVLPEGTTVGVSFEEDRARGYTVTESGIVVVSNHS